MAENFRQQVERVELKARMVVDRYHDALARMAELENELSDARANLLVLKAENEKLSAELEYRRVVNTVAPDAETRRQTREMLREIVSDIDRCITELLD